MASGCCLRAAVEMMASVMALRHTAGSSATGEAYRPQRARGERPCRAQYRGVAGHIRLERRLRHALDRPEGEGHRHPDDADSNQEIRGDFENAVAFSLPTLIHQCRLLKRSCRRSTNSPRFRSSRRCVISPLSLPCRRMTIGPERQMFVRHLDMDLEEAARRDRCASYCYKRHEYVRLSSKAQVFTVALGKYVFYIAVVNVRHLTFAVGAFVGRLLLEQCLNIRMVVAVATASEPQALALSTRVLFSTAGQPLSHGFKGRAVW